MDFTQTGLAGRATLTNINPNEVFIKIITVKIDPCSTVQEVRRRILRTMIYNADPDDYLLFFPILEAPPTNQNVRQVLEKRLNHTAPETTGVWLDDEKLMLYYYNNFDGSRNVIFQSFSVQD